MSLKHPPIRMMFKGLMSPWRMPLLCRWAMHFAIWMENARIESLKGRGGRGEGGREQYDVSTWDVSTECPTYVCVT